MDNIGVIFIYRCFFVPIRKMENVKTGNLKLYNEIKNWEINKNE